ncbi:hypothetical protein MBLNU230_g0942t1 [Neophaeotheca triangularis]
MRRQALEYVCASCRHTAAAPRASRIQKRQIQISATPTSTSPQQTLDSKHDSTSPAADARFEVLGSPISMLAVQVAASQNLYTRKGTLVGFSGNPENAVSTISLLEPFRRAAMGIPFVYQRIKSTTPYNALIATKSSVSSLVVVHLDGRLDWMIAQRNALLAWTGHTLSLTPRLNTKMSLAHWGSTSVTGRGLLALSGKGQIHQITLKTGESYVVHPSNLIAYAMMQNPPQPYRFKSNLLRFQVPSMTAWLPDTRFWRTMRESTAWNFIRNSAFVLRTWARKTIWGDRLFLQFQGPANLLIQSRGSSLTDALDVNEIADSPAGSLSLKAHEKSPAEAGAQTSRPSTAPTPTMGYASVSQDGKVEFQKS